MSGSSHPQVPERAPQLVEFFPLKDIPARLPAGPNGRRLHPKVPIRWATKGVRGVQLRFVSAGRLKLTTEAWLVAFLEAVARAQQPAPVRPIKKTSDTARRAKTKAILAGVGLGNT